MGAPQPSRQPSRTAPGAIKHARQTPTVENAVSGIEALHDDMVSEFRILKEDVGALKEDVGALKKDVGALKKDVGALKEDVGALKKDVGKLLHHFGLVSGDTP